MIMSTFSDQTEFNVMKMWLEGQENNGILQTLQEKYDTSYYSLLRKKDDTNIGLRSVTNDKVVRYNKYENKKGPNNFFMYNNTLYYILFRCK